MSDLSKTKAQKLADSIAKAERLLREKKAQLTAVRTEERYALEAEVFRSVQAILMGDLPAGSSSHEKLERDIHREAIRNALDWVHDRSPFSGAVVVLLRSMGVSCPDLIEEETRIKTKPPARKKAPSKKKVPSPKLYPPPAPPPPPEDPNTIEFDANRNPSNP